MAIILKMLANSNSVFQITLYQQETMFINCITSSRPLAQLTTHREAIDSNSADGGEFAVIDKDLALLRRMVKANTKRYLKCIEVKGAKFEHLL